MSKLTKALTAAAGNAGGTLGYVEDVFSTYLYTGNGGTEQAIVNNVDLLNEGGLVWIKERANAGTESHQLFDTERGSTLVLHTEGTSGNSNYGTAFKSFNSDGFSVQDSGYAVNDLNATYASWTFRKAEKFFDVVTYTGDGVAGRTVAHNLGSAPGCIIVKRTDSADGWQTYHQSLGSGYYVRLNTDAASAPTSSYWNSTDPTSTVFTVGDAGGTNANGGTYVAYLFAHDAGGFGDDGSESIIKCGSVTTDGSGNASVDVGFEPQWCLWKCVDAAGGNEHGNWRINDTMRGWRVPDASNTFGYPSSLYANTSGAETISGVDGFIKSATGFGFGQVQANKTYIYIAIRRPMKTPESGTEVFAADNEANNTAPWYTSGFPVDWAWQKQQNTASNWNLGTRLLSRSSLRSDSTVAELTYYSEFVFDYMDGWNSTTGTASNMYSAMFKRATGFFDVVAYTGNGTAGTAQAHNLGVVPEMMIGKNRSNSSNWMVYHTGATYTAGAGLKLNTTAAGVSNTYDFGNGSGGAQRPDASSVYLGGNVNSTNDNYILYLFASVDGVSKVGSYTGTGADLNVDCGFSAGARFILIKRSDSTGDWYVWDSVRGITAGNDPYLLLNSTDAEVTSTDYIDPLSSGFTVTSSAPAELNASGGTYIFLAIAQVT